MSRIRADGSTSSVAALDDCQKGNAATAIAVLEIG